MVYGTVLWHLHALILFCFLHILTFGTFVNIMISMVKPFLSTEHKDTLKSGYQFSDRLDQCFLIPDADTARARNYARIVETLQIRYKNEASFRL